MIACQRDDWLSAVTGHSCHRVSGEGDSASVSAALAEAGDGFFFAKSPVTAVASMKYFTDAGFFLVDTNITLEMPAVASVRTASSVISVFPVRPVDHDAVQKMAETSFIYSRFHLDPLFLNVLANRVKREWVRSYCEGRRGDKLFVAERGGLSLALTYAFRPDNYLIGVSGSVTGLGPDGATLLSGGEDTQVLFHSVAELTR